MLAKETGLPMFLHSREVGLDFVEILERNRDKLTTGVVHSFTGTAEELQRILDLGLYVSVNGASLRTAEQIEVVKTIPVALCLAPAGRPSDLDPCLAACIPSALPPALRERAEPKVRAGA